GEGRVVRAGSGEPEPLFGELDPGGPMQQVEEDEHALSGRQASLDDRFEAAERAASDGDGAAGDDGVHLDDAVGPRARAQAYDHVGSHAGRRVAERDETQRTAAT